MFIRAFLILTTLTVDWAFCADDSGMIMPGDRLEVRFGGEGFAGTEVSIVQSNGTVLIGDSTYARVQGKSAHEAGKTISGLVYVSNGTTNLITEASLRKIAQVPAPLILNVFQHGDSNVVFRLTNETTNSFRVPSAGYVLLDAYRPVNTNPAYAISDRPHVSVGLWLTRDWRHVGTNWMLASHEKWRERLNIRTLTPGNTLDVIRGLGPWGNLLRTNTNAIAYFHFEIPREWAEEYGLWEGSLRSTGLTRNIKK